MIVGIFMTKENISQEDEQFYKDKIEMVTLAKEFAADLDYLLKKYNSKLKPYFSFLITQQNFRQGIDFGYIYKLVLLETYTHVKDGIVDLQQNNSI